MTQENRKNNVGVRLRRLRRLRGFASPKALAEAVDDPRVTTAGITNVENGRKADLTLTEAVLIAHALNVTPLALMFDSFDPYAVPEEYAALGRTNLEHLQFAGEDLFFDSATESLMKMAKLELPPLDGFALANALDRALANAEAAEKYSHMVEDNFKPTNNLSASQRQDIMQLKMNAADARRYLELCDAKGVRVPEDKRSDVAHVCAAAGLGED